MLYTSPFEILDVPGAELQQMDRRMLLLKKKQLLAELELQSSPFIVIKNKEFTKNDILTLFEQLENGGAVEYHAAVAADTVLLNFLQTGILKPGQKFAYNDLYKEPAFIEFISPFYKAAFNQFVLKAVASSNYDTTGAVFSNPLLLNGTDYDECLGKLHSYLEEKLQGIEILKNSFAVNRRTDLSSLHSYYIYDWVLTLNNLPDDFSGYRESYAVDLYNFVVDLWNGKKRDEATAMLYGIESIKTDGNVKKLIADLINKLSAVQQPAGSSGRSSGGSVAWAIISLIIVMLRVASTCNKSSSYSSYNNYPSSTYFKDQFTTGYMPFNPSNKRETAFLTLLKKLENSTAPTYKVKKTTGLTTGDDPYKAIFSRPVFQPVPDSVNEKTQERINYQPPRIVKDDEVSTSTIRETAEKVDEVALLPLKLNNNLTIETILFFISNEKVFSVYLAPQSMHTINIARGSYYLFGYGGINFSNSLPLKNSNNPAVYTDKKNLAGMGRFDVINSKMIKCLDPDNNINFIAGFNGIDEVGEAASVTIDFDNTEYFSMKGGHGISPVKTLRPRRLSSPY